MAEGVLVFASICKWKFFIYLFWTISSYFWLKRMPWRNSVSQYRTCRITLRQPLESCFNGSLLPWLRICLFRICIFGLSELHFYLSHKMWKANTHSSPCLPTKTVGTSKRRNLRSPLKNARMFFHRRPCCLNNARTVTLLETGTDNMDFR